MFLSCETEPNTFNPGGRCWSLLKDRWRCFSVIRWVSCFFLFSSCPIFKTSLLIARSFHIGNLTRVLRLSSKLPVLHLCAVHRHLDYIRWYALTLTMAFLPFAMTTVSCRSVDSSSFFQHKVCRSYNSRTAWPRITNFYTDLHTVLVHMPDMTSVASSGRQLLQKKALKMTTLGQISRERFNWGTTS